MNHARDRQCRTADRSSPQPTGTAAATPATAVEVPVPRGHKRTVRLYQPKLSRFWWIRFTLPPHVAPHFRPLSEDPSDNKLPLPGTPNMRPDKNGRISFSLETSSKPTAEKMQRRYQLLLDRAWEHTLDRKFIEAVTGNRTHRPRTIKEFFDDVQRKCDEKITFRQAHPNPLDPRYKIGIDRHTAHDYELARRYFTQFLEEEFPRHNVHVHDVGTDSDAQVHLSKFKDWFFTKKGLGAESWQKTRGHLSWAWNAIAVPNKFTDANPWSNDSLRPPREADKRYAIATADQRNAILSAKPSWENRALKLILITGRRVAELCWIQRCHVDVKNKRITWIISKTQHEKERPLTDLQLEILQDQMASHTSDWIFPRDDGGQCAPHYLQTQLGRALQRILKPAQCQLPHISPQSLRRNFATRARQARTTAHDIKDLMGHETLEQHNTYVQEEPELLRQAAEEVERRIVSG